MTVSDTPLITLLLKRQLISLEFENENENELS